MDINLKTATLLELADELVKQQNDVCLANGTNRSEARRDVASIRAEMDRRDRENAKPRTVWLVLGEHFSVPGLVQKTFATKALADAEALELVNLMMRDTEGGKERKRGWEKGLEWLQDYHGARDCDVAVSELKVEG